MMIMKNKKIAACEELFSIKKTQFMNKVGRLADSAAILPKPCFWSTPQMNIALPCNLTVHKY